MYLLIAEKVLAFFFPPLRKGNICYLTWQVTMNAIMR